MSLQPKNITGLLLEAKRHPKEPFSLREWLAREPRVTELLWFLQWQEMQPGGLEGMVSAMIAAVPEWFVTKGMAEAGRPKNGEYTLDQKLAIFNVDHPGGAYFERRQDFESKDYHLLADVSITDLADDSEYFLNIPGGMNQDHLFSLPKKDRDLALKFFGRIEPDKLAARCQSYTESGLPNLLRAFVSRPQSISLRAWYCHDVFGALVAYMDHHEAVELGKVAKTKVAERVFQEVDFSLRENVATPIIGESRLGKTKSGEAKVRSRPGLARLVTVPDGNCERKFFEAVADAFGHEYSLAMPTRVLRADVEFLCRHSGLFLFFDEAHFLVPSNYSKTTAPRRLNWIRSEIIDRGSGCAFFATPQSYRQTLDQYMKTTGYRMEQWLGRLALPVLLPDALEAGDILMVAKNNFPDLEADYLELIAARAMRTVAPLKTLELAAKRARYLAKGAGRSKVTLADIDGALDYAAPARADQRPAQVEPLPESAAGAGTLQLGCRRGAKRFSASPVAGGLTDESHRALASRPALVELVK